MTRDVLMELVKRVLNAPKGAYLEPMPIPMKLPEELDYNELYEMSARQKVGQIVSYALKWDWDDVEDYERFVESMSWAIALEGTMFCETNALFEAFEREGIDYCPINGIVTKRFYPLPWMRTMSDADVLIREKDASGAKQIAESVGFIKDRPIDGAAAFISASRLYRLELHTRLDTDGAGDIWNKLEPAKRNGRRYEMTNISQFVYILRRCDRHMRAGGIKLLSVLDFILLKKNLGLDEPLAERAVKDSGLNDAFDTLSGVASAWLDYGVFDKKQSAFVDGIFEERAVMSGNQGFISAFARALKGFRIK